MVAVEDEKNARPHAGVLNVPNCYLVYLKSNFTMLANHNLTLIQYLSPGTNPPGSSDQIIKEATCWVLGMGREGFSFFLPIKSLRMKEEE
jgi:hypothetical protein